MKKVIIFTILLFVLIITIFTSNTYAVDLDEIVDYIEENS